MARKIIATITLDTPDHQTGELYAGEDGWIWCRNQVTGEEQQSPVKVPSGMTPEEAIRLSWGDRVWHLQFVD
jgi:hypothetical protein